MTGSESSDGMLWTRMKSVWAPMNTWLFCTERITWVALSPVFFVHEYNIYGLSFHILLCTWILSLEVRKCYRLITNFDPNGWAQRYWSTRIGGAVIVTKGKFQDCSSRCGLFLLYHHGERGIESCDLWYICIFTSRELIQSSTPMYHTYQRVTNNNVEKRCNHNFGITLYYTRLRQRFLWGMHNDALFSINSWWYPVCCTS
jgi:hypothetical protein